MGSSKPRRARSPVAPAKYDVKNHSLVLFDRGDEITVQAGDEGIRFLLVSGKPIEEPVAWYGPIVMNTQEQLRQAVPDEQPAVLVRGGVADEADVAAVGCKGRARLVVRCVDERREWREGAGAAAVGVQARTRCRRGAGRRREGRAGRR